MASQEPASAGGEAAPSRALIVEGEYDLCAVRKARYEPPLGRGEGGKAIKSEWTRPAAGYIQSLDDRVGPVGQSHAVAQQTISGEQLADIRGEEGGGLVRFSPACENLLDLVGRASALAKLHQESVGNADHPREADREPDGARWRLAQQV
jgi:hypothetical protein